MPLITTLAGASARGYGGFLTSEIPGAFESIATTTVGSGGTSTITFNSIPSTYKHLQIRYVAKNTRTTAGWQDIMMRFNSDSGSTSYMCHVLSGNGTSGSSGTSGSVNHIQIGNALPSSATGETNMFGVGIIDILDYASSDKRKTVRALYGWDKNGSGQVKLGSGVWLNTSAITRIDFTTDSLLYAQNSSIALYGIKGA